MNEGRLGRAVAMLLTIVACCPAANVTDALSHAEALRQSGKLSDARAAFQELPHKFKLNPAQQASVFMELSRIDLAQGHYASAIDEGERAAALFGSQTDRLNEGNSLTITGLAHTYAGEYSEALCDSERALTIARDTRDRPAEITRLNNIGNVFYFQGRYADALERYRSAMRLVDASPKETWSASRRQLTVANLASIYQRLGQYDLALDEYSGLRASHAALKIPEQAQLLANMGALYRRLGDPVKALETYRAAQTLYRREEMRTGEIAVLNNIGIAQALDLRQLPDALLTFNQALQMAETSGDKPVALHARLYRAETLFRMGRIAESRSDFAAAAELADSLHATEEQWKALYGLARIAEREQDPSRATSLLRDAIGLIESLRESGPGALREGFLADKRQVYDSLIVRLAGEPNPNAAELFRLMELSRARTLQDRKKINVTLEGVRRELPADTLLLEYWIGEDSVAVLWAAAGNCGVAYRPAGLHLRERLRAFGAILADARSEQWHDVAASIAGELLCGVARPLANSAIHKLIVIPDREVSLVPFETLPLVSRHAERLVDAFTVSYLPSASLLKRQVDHRQAVPFWQRTVLAFADPAPGGGKAALTMAASADARRLPAAVREVQDIAALVGGRTALFIGVEARKDRLRLSLAEHFPIVHLATHAFSDPEDPARSYILLAGANSAQAYDYLFLNEVSTLDLHGVDLVTVSACKTETGKLVEGEGVASFSRTFLSSGAGAVVTSLWQVGDQSTADLMEIFYRGLARGATAADALRNAKSEYLRSGSGRRAHPFYWAAFVLNGQPDVRIPYVLPWTFAGAGILGLFGIVVLLWNWRRNAVRTTV